MAGMLAATTACSSGGSQDAGGRTTVVASFYPLAEAVRQVGGDDVRVTDLTQPGAEPHDLELSTRQVGELLDADLAVVMGHRFQPGVEKVAGRRDGPTVFGLDLPGVLGNGSDPHVWLDPMQMVRLVDGVAAALGRARPASAARFRAGAARYVVRLRALDVDYRAGLAGCQGRSLVTSHAAFGWLAKRYGLQQKAISGLAPGEEADPRRLAELIDVVRREHVRTVFAETLVSPAVAETLARESGATTSVLDPIEGLTTKALAAGADYLSVMRSNLRTLRTGLGC
jgi:zinc transport system substrate-binding protein